MPKKKDVVPLRGDRIRITKGAHGGSVGWMNQALEPTVSSFHIILDDAQEASQDRHHLACVRKTSIVPHLKDPQSVEEFVVLEDPKVQFHLGMLAQAVAEAGVSTTEPLLKIIKEQIDVACVVKLSKGKKAKYSEVALCLAKAKEHVQAQVQNDAHMPDIAILRG